MFAMRRAPTRRLSSLRETFQVEKVREYVNRANKDPLAYWEAAARRLPWFEPWTSVFMWNKDPNDSTSFSWFKGGKTNLCYSALDSHVSPSSCSISSNSFRHSFSSVTESKAKSGKLETVNFDASQLRFGDKFSSGDVDRSNQLALHYMSEDGTTRTYTYAQLLVSVKEYAAALRGLGVKKGDRVTLYMPTCPEAVMLMLACTRIGAIHSVIFAGFGAKAIADRVVAAGSNFLFTSDVTARRGHEVPLLPMVREAVQIASDTCKREGTADIIKNVIVLPRSIARPSVSSDKSGRPSDVCAEQQTREMTWAEFLRHAAKGTSEVEKTSADDPAFILATSGTTSKPKLVIHRHGGYQVHISQMADVLFGMKAGERILSLSDIGWIVGHSYIVYAPLILGTTTYLFEGGLDYPTPFVSWNRFLQDYNPDFMFTSPTAIRMWMKSGAAGFRAAALSAETRLSRIFCAGEVLNPPAWDWLQNTVFENRVPVLDHMWQSETGGPVMGNPFGIGRMPIKAGSCGIPLPGIEVSVVDPQAADERVPPGLKANVAFTAPFPGLISDIWGEPGRYNREYWEKIYLKSGASARMYATGDAAHLDQDGYVWFAGRADEVLKIAAHRISVIEVESAFLMHPAVAEAGVTGQPDEIRGEIIAAFVVLKDGFHGSDSLKQEIINTVRRELGHVAVIGSVRFVKMIPKTRSGKIVRRALRAVVAGKDVGDISTLEDGASIEEARKAVQQLGLAAA
ncbi:mitochondrial acetyl-CoA synthetase [Andalucia godoyi]|uniref:acetate--CoA ligase n=1 Tax=Andalucia godoyi TaxID=505711 RepID=A0A8K0AIN0_ANDGO|nr:mitochondrial acetyl-CoA synthetase [Andalucia godoyi]|eukprot:ANDGO_02361.mRNA.1 mitochondrial acetyl-CoA synthetase